MLRKRVRHVALGDAARDAGDWRAAIPHYQNALAEQPSLTHIWIQLGHARKETGDPAGAEAAYRRALELTPTDPDAHLQLGHLLKITGRGPEAVQAYTEAARLDGGLQDANRELDALVPDRERVFELPFRGPQLVRRAPGGIVFDVWASLEGEHEADILRLQEAGLLRLRYRLHGAYSGSPVAYEGEAAPVLAGGGLRCRVILPNPALGHGPAHLVRLDRLGTTHGKRAWEHPGVWLAVLLPDDRLAQHYAAHAGRPTS